jgi:flavin reductase (DIM6/NTAB) family NADH-FMN oxidoreductase RutF
MKRWLTLLRNGKGLRHLPVTHSDSPAPAVRVVLAGLRPTPLDVTHDHVPVSLRPLILGVRLAASLDSPSSSHNGISLHFFDPLEGSSPIARIGLRKVGELTLFRDSLQLFEATDCHNRCVPPITRWVRYALSWQHARHAKERQDGLCMSASDLICLNAYYIVQRPVFLVSVAHEGSDNFFPMDLVGKLSSGEFMLALRATSPAIELMERSRQLALSAAPAVHIQATYALGAHHRRRSVDLGALPFRTQPSPEFGLPVIADAERVIEVAIQETHRIGSHVLFVSRVIHDSGRAETQLAHVSSMYAEWRSRHHQPLPTVVSV